MSAAGGVGSKVAFAIFFRSLRSQSPRGCKSSFVLEVIIASNLFIYVGT